MSGKNEELRTQIILGNFNTNLREVIVSNKQFAFVNKLVIAIQNKNKYRESETRFTVSRWNAETQGPGSKRVPLLVFLKINHLNPVIHHALTDYVNTQVLHICKI